MRGTLHLLHNLENPSAGASKGGARLRMRGLLSPKEYCPENNPNTSSKCLCKPLIRPICSI